MSTIINDAEEHRINSTTLRDQAAPALAQLGQGHVVVWQSRQPPPDYSNPQLPPGFDLYMQRFDDTGRAVGGETHVNSVAINDQVQPVVCALPDGGFVIAWASAREHGMTGFDHGVYFQRFDAQGNRLGGETQANNFYGLDQERPSIAALDNGGFVVTWWSDVQSTMPPGIYARIFDADGMAIGAEARVGTTSGPQSDSVVAGLQGGGFVIAWDCASGVHSQRFDAGGAAAGVETLVNTGGANGAAQPSVAALADGGYVVAWQAADTDGSGILLQRFSADGTPKGYEIAVNATTIGDQSAPSVTAIEGGGFAVAWTSMAQDGSGEGVYSQLFDAAGYALGSETQLNHATAGDQGDAALTSDGHGGYLAAWTSIGQDGSGAGVYGTTVANGAEDGSLWQAAALLWAGLGSPPGMSLLGQWTAQADHAGDMGDLGQSMIDYYAAGVSSDVLVTHLYTNLARVAPPADIVQSLSSQIGAGLAFETQGDFFAAAASLPINTDHLAGLVGSVEWSANRSNKRSSASRRLDGPSSTTTSGPVGRSAVRRSTTISFSGTSRSIRQQPDDRAATRSPGSDSDAMS